MDSACRNCRREGIKLFLKVEKCFTAKCPVSRRAYPPGVHGPKGSGKPTEYGTQLREKQKAKRIYGVRERQFRNYVEGALTKTGNTAEHLLRTLEQRLDTVIRRAGYAVSQRQARQLVNHGHFLLNAKKVSIPSLLVQSGDVITVRRPDELSNLQNVIAVNTALERPQQVPGWLSVDRDAKRIEVLRLPTVGDVESTFDPKLIIEFYSR